MFLLLSILRRNLDYSHYLGLCRFIFPTYLLKYHLHCVAYDIKKIIIIQINTPGYGSNFKAIFFYPLKHILILQEKSGETVCSESNEVWLCPLCQQGLPDRGSLALHLNDGHSVLPNCVDKLLDIVSSAMQVHSGLVFLLLFSHRTSQQNLTFVSVFNE